MGVKAGHARHAGQCCGGRAGRTGRAARAGMAGKVGRASRAGRAERAGIVFGGVCLGAMENVSKSHRRAENAVQFQCMKRGKCRCFVLQFSPGQL